ncbi:hypothetical protein CCHOA_08685 [Corynebacterium choanae]|uniref:Uncharacterized protein n=1 Tax=Corynebacterium choanae TaxID=1862358 RepID=A0A3G6J816_9CORY|nr:hypothetical protein CCHOA_08685 [Corynebacterium choanae]
MTWGLFPHCGEAKVLMKPAKPPGSTAASPPLTTVRIVYTHLTLGQA